MSERMQIVWERGGDGSGEFEWRKIGVEQAGRVIWLGWQGSHVSRAINESFEADVEFARQLCARWNRATEV